jgi:hypothetical protein
VKYVPSHIEIGKHLETRKEMDSGSRQKIPMRKLYRTGFPSKIGAPLSVFGWPSHRNEFSGYDDTGVETTRE